MLLALMLYNKLSIITKGSLGQRKRALSLALRGLLERYCARVIRSWYCFSTLRRSLIILAYFVSFQQPLVNCYLRCLSIYISIYTKKILSSTTSLELTVAISLGSLGLFCNAFSLLNVSGTKLSRPGRWQIYKLYSLRQIAVQMRRRLLRSIDMVVRGLFSIILFIAVQSVNTTTRWFEE